MDKKEQSKVSKEVSALFKKHKLRGAVMYVVIDDNKKVVENMELGVSQVGNLNDSEFYIDVMPNIVRLLPMLMDVFNQKRVSSPKGKVKEVEISEDGDDEEVDPVSLNDIPDNSKEMYR